MKRQVAHAEMAFEQARRASRDLRSEVADHTNARSQCQRDINALLQRKHAWSNTDVSTFTRLFADEHALEAAGNELKVRAERAEKLVERQHDGLMSAIRERYREEQMWSDKVSDVGDDAPEYSSLRYSTSNRAFIARTPRHHIDPRSQLLRNVCTHVAEYCHGRRLCSQFLCFSFSSWKYGHTSPCTCRLPADRAQFISVHGWLEPRRREQLVERMRLELAPVNSATTASSPLRFVPSPERIASDKAEESSALESTMSISSKVDVASPNNATVTAELSEIRSKIGELLVRERSAHNTMLAMERLFDARVAAFEKVPELAADQATTSVVRHGYDMLTNMAVVSSVGGILGALLVVLVMK